VIGVYTGPDSYELLDEIFGPLFRQLPLVVPESLTHLGKLSGDHGDMKTISHDNQCVTHKQPIYIPTSISLNNIVWFVGGDLNWLHLILGLQPCQATYFCCQCLATLDDLREKKQEKKPLSPDQPIASGAPTRSLQSLTGHASLYIKKFNPGDDWAKHCYGSIHYPLVPFEIKTNRIVPPVLHIMIGLTMDLHNEIVKICKQRDAIAVAKQVAFPSDSNWQQKLNEIEIAKQQTEDARIAKRLAVKKRSFNQYKSARQEQIKNQNLSEVSPFFVVFCCCCCCCFFFFFFFFLFVLFVCFVCLFVCLFVGWLVAVVVLLRLLFIVVMLLG
jgi:hypothetical protein